MKLEFLDDLSSGGKFTGVTVDQLIRVYDFDKLQAGKFRQEIQEKIIRKEKKLDL